jgi:hypothetical protein
MRKCISMSQIADYAPLVLFYKQYFKDELQQKISIDTSSNERVMARQRGTYEFLDAIKKKGVVKVTRQYFINPTKYIENL